MLHGGGGPGLVQEALAVFGVSRQVALEDLQRKRLGSTVARDAVDAAHPALAQPPLHAIGAEHVAGLELGLLRRRVHIATLRHPARVKVATSAATDR